jgi:hypothetical protein
LLTARPGGTVDAESTYADPGKDCQFPSRWFTRLNQ